MLSNIYRNAWVFILSVLSMPSMAVTQPGTADFSLLPVVASLLVVIAVILLLALAMKRFNLGFPGSRAIKMVGALSLGNRERVVVIEINGKQHALGVTSQQINHLFSLDEPLESADSGGGKGSGQASEKQFNTANQPLTFQKILENLGKKND